MTLYALQMSDGSVALMQTSGAVTPAACLAKWPPAEAARVVAHQPIDAAAIPQDRTFRNAWTLNGGKVEHDMAKAREIQRNRLRAERAGRLADLDLAYVRADEAQDATAKAAVVAQKQALRDVTDAPQIAAAQTVADLKALTLDVLAPAAAVVAGDAIADTP